MTWNHRVIRKVYKASGWSTPPQETILGIHEVFYKDGIPSMVTKNPVNVCGDNLKELSQTLRWMSRALRQPVLDYSDFEEGGKYYTDERISIPQAPQGTSEEEAI